MTISRDFELAVSALFDCDGWVVDSDVTIAGCQIDLIARKPIAGIQHTMAVECTLERVNARKFAADFAHLISIRTQHPRYRLCIVSALGFSRGVKDRADASGIDLLTYTQLQSAILGFDMSVYARSLVTSKGWIENKNQFIIPTLTWDSSCSNNSGTLNAFDLLDKWLSSDTIRVLTLLGDYGTGKTLLLKAYAAKLAEIYLRAPFTTPFPVFVELRTVRNCRDVSHALAIALERAGISTPNLGLIITLAQQGRFILIFDGLDEFVDEYDLAEVTRVLLDFTFHETKIAKVLLSCRTHYFRSSNEAIKAFSPEAETTNIELVSPVYREISSRPEYGIVNLDSFDKDMIDEFFTKTLGSNQLELEKNCPWIRSVNDLMTRPILLDMIASTLPEIKELDSKVTVTEYDLYDLYTRRWAKREAWRRSWTVEARLNFARFLAFSMFLNENNSVHYNTLLDKLSLFLETTDTITRDDLSTVETDARTATFLIRDSEGNYRFAHRSFSEFFLAQHILSSLQNGRGHSLMAQIYPKYLPWNAARFLKYQIHANKLMLNSLLPSSPSPVKDRNIVLMIDDVQCGGEMKTGKILRNCWDKLGHPEMVFLSVPDSISGLLYAYYLLPLVVMHDNSNIMWGHEFVEYYKLELAPLGILLILHHASFDAQEVLRLVREGTVVTEIRKPINFSDFREALDQCIQIRNMSMVTSGTLSRTE